MTFSIKVSEENGRINKDAKEFQKCQQVKEQAVPYLRAVVGRVETVHLCHCPCWAHLRGQSLRCHQIIERERGYVLI